jgi:hypothetical protein
MAQEKQLLTKSAFLMGLACDKLLWIYQNQREPMPEADETAQAVQLAGRVTHRHEHEGHCQKDGADAEHQNDLSSGSHGFYQPVLTAMMLS